MIVEKAYAKLNLALDVTSKRNDGYHNLEMIMVSLELHDVLTFELHERVILDCNVEIHDNSVLKAAKMIQERYQVTQGVKITLEKHIPIGAGLGGGSSDVAATIRGLDVLWDLNLSKQDKEHLALSLGSDTLFSLYGEPAYVTGRGEHIEFLKPIYIPIVYLYPSLIEVSTKTVFSNHEVKEAEIPFDTLVYDYQNQIFDRFKERAYNALIPTTLKVYPALKSHVKTLKKIDPFVKMTGSGSTFFSILFNPDDEVILKKLLKNSINFIKTQTKA